MMYKSSARKRAYIALAGTTAGLVGIIGFHTGKALPALVDQRTSSMVGRYANGHNRSRSEGTGSGGGRPEHEWKLASTASFGRHVISCAQRHRSN